MTNETKVLNVAFENLERKNVKNSNEKCEKKLKNNNSNSYSCQYRGSRRRRRRCRAVYVWVRICFKTKEKPKNKKRFVLGMCAAMRVSVVCADAAVRLCACNKLLRQFHFF